MPFDIFYRALNIILKIIKTKKLIRLGRQVTTAQPIQTEYNGICLIRLEQIKEK